MPVAARCTRFAPPRPDPRTDPEGFWEDSLLRGIEEGRRRRRERLAREAAEPPRSPES